MDLPILIFKVLPLFGTPIVAGIAWWRWLRGERMAPRSWRATALLSALAAGSANALLFYSWLVYQLIAGGSERAWRVQSILGDVAVYLVLAGLLGGIVGKGRGRILTLLLAIMGFLLWVPIAIL